MGFRMDCAPWEEGAMWIATWGGLAGVGLKSEETELGSECAEG